MGAIAERSTAAFERLRSFYAWALDRALARRGIVLILTVVSIALMVWGFAVIPKGFFPTEDTGLLFINTQAAPDISFAAMQEKQTQLANILRRDPAIDGVSSVVGASGSSSALNTGRIFASLKPRNRRDAASAVQTRLRRQLNRVPGIQAFPNIVQNLTIGGRAGSGQYQYTLAGLDTAALYPFASKLEARLRDAPGFADVITDLQLGARQARLVIDRDAASRAGVTVDAIHQALYAAFGQLQVSTIYAPADSYEVIIESKLSEQIDPDSMSRIQVRGGTGSANATAAAATDGNTNLSQDTSRASTTGSTTLVPLSAVASIQVEPAPLSVNHQSELPAVTISFNLVDGASLSDAQSEIERDMADLHPPVGVVGSFQGSAQAFQQSAEGEGTLFLAAILVIYIVLGVLYESFIHPITILSGLPSAGLGALAALWLLGMPLDVIGIIGVVLLIGIVKKNAIMMVDFALVAQREQGLSALDAARQACLIRFRPIMMTTFAAFAAALPVALGLGSGGELRQPLGVAVGGGLLVSQVVTLFITPVIYVAFENLAARARRVRQPALQPGE